MNENVKSAKKNPGPVNSFDGERLTGSWAPVFMALRDAIIGHRIPPATKLPEDEVATIYNVSRTSVRQALHELARIGLVNHQPNRGAFVAQPDKREAREVFEARALIEPHVAFLACDNSSPERVAMLRQHLEDEQKAIREGRVSDSIMLSARFHVAIAELADHSVLTGMVKELVLRSSLIIALYWQRRDTTCERHAHLTLVDAIARRQKKDAAELMKSHIIDLLSGLDLSPAKSRDAKTLSELLDGKLTE